MHVSFDPATTSWRATWSSWLLVLQLRDHDLHVTYLGPRHAADRTVSTIGVAEHLAYPLVSSHQGLRVHTRECGRQTWSLAGWETPEPDVILIRLQARQQPLTAVSEWRLDPETDVLSHSLTLRNDGGQNPVTVCEVSSLSICLPDTRQLTYLSGQWVRETQAIDVSGRTPLLLESRSGKTGFEFAPYLAVHGTGYTAVVTLAWSGNWFLHTLPVLNDTVHVSAGVNPWHLAHELPAGRDLRLPTATIAITDGDLNGATQLLHRHRRRRLSRRRYRRPVPVQFNSWYPYQTRPDITAMTALAEEAAELGCEVFVQDAGWYTNEGASPTESWWQRTGDWLTDLERFPKGVSELSSFVHERGMLFGIWFEPEAISRGSATYRDHPQWTHPTESAGPGRAILDLGNRAALEWISDRLLRVLSDVDADWMKWDLNLNLVIEQQAQQLNGPDPVVAHTLGVYALQERLLRNRPELFLEMCAGGGGRFDDAIMDQAATQWMSDQTQALPNLSIHFGSQLAHLPEECNDWLVDWPPHDSTCGLTSVDARGDLDLRAHVAMLGSFGISAPVGRWSEADKRRCTQHVAWYKDNIRPLFAGCDQYLLTDQPGLDGAGGWGAVWYVADDGAAGHLTTVRLSEGPPSQGFPLHGLDSDRLYEVSTPDCVVGRYSGRELGETGMDVLLEQPFTSQVFGVRATDRK